MSVKGLVGAYEARAAPSQRPSPRNTRAQADRSAAAPTVDGLPGPSLHRPSQVHTGASLPTQSLSSLTGDTTLRDDITTHTHDTFDETTADVTDEIHEYHRGTKSQLSFISRTSKPSQHGDPIEMKRLLSSKEPPDSLDPKSANPRRKSTLAVDSSHIPQSPSPTPIAAATVFARGAAPLSFPELDAHLSSISPPPFHSLASKDGVPAMFVPFQVLTASGKTLDDLEKNAQIPHWWQNRNKIVGSLASLALSITVWYLLPPCS